MPSGPNVGYATMSIIPSMRGMERRLGSEIDGPLRRETDRSGERAGESFMTKFGDKAKLAAAGAAVAIGAVLATGIAGALENEQAIDRMAASLGLDPATQERLGRVAGDVFAGAYGDSMGDVTAAVGSVFTDLEGQLGGLSLQGATEQALNLADAFDIDVQRAISSAGNLMETGLARDADHAFDLMTAGLQEMPIALREELFEASDEYGRFFSGLGLSAEETFGILADAAQGGVYGIDKTGDALKELTIRATDMSATSVGAYEAAGLGAEDMAARFLAGGDSARGALDDLVAGLLGIEDPTLRANSAIALFGTPLEDLGVTEIPAFLESLGTMGASLGDVSGAAEEMGDTLGDNAATKIEAFKRKALQALTTFIGDHVIPIAERLGEWFGEKMPPLVDRLRTTFETWGPRVQAVIEPVARVVGEFFGFLARNEDVVMAIGIAIAAVLVPAFILWAVSALAAAAGTLVALAPLILIAAGIALLAYIVIRNWDTIKAATAAVWNFIGRALSTVWEGIKSGVGSAVSWISDKWDAMVSFVTGLPGRISDAASGMWNGIKEAFRSAVNFIIRAWNGLEFTIPGFDPPGPGSFGGFTLGVPNIPQLADGGIVRARAGGVLALLAEGGQDEAVVPLDDEYYTGDRGRTVVEFRADSVYLLRWLREAVRTQGGGNVQVALGKGA